MDDGDAPFNRMRLLSAVYSLQNRTCNQDCVGDGRVQGVQGTSFQAVVACLLQVILSRVLVRHQVALGSQSGNAHPEVLDVVPQPEDLFLVLRKPRHA